MIEKITPTRAVIINKFLVFIVKILSSIIDLTVQEQQKSQTCSLTKKIFYYNKMSIQRQLLGFFPRLEKRRLCAADLSLARNFKVCRIKKHSTVWVLMLFFPPWGKAGNALFNSGSVLAWMAHSSEYRDSLLALALIHLTQRQFSRGEVWPLFHRDV